LTLLAGACERPRVPDTAAPLATDTLLTALVTGAGRGIGRAAAVRLGREGYRVALTARSEDELRETATMVATETLVLPADMLDPTAPDTVVSAVEQAWGGLSVLVANAGAGSSAPVAKISDELWAQQLELNLTAPFRAVRRSVPGMVERGWGRLIVVASMAAKRGEPYLGAYCASKHGILGLVRAAAAELATTGVTANAVCPAYVDTAMTDGAVGMIQKFTGQDAAAARRFLELKQPIGRLITVDEVAEAVWFCVANGGVTGQGLNVDGGAVQG
jgi:NAD(P)-dependent dehydrogenase (short-subunit alcohol dehydrogenase family)